mgnify:CR=1 FL=1
MSLWGLLRFDGLDTQSFLQGQLTNNITALSATRSQYAGYCTPKGRLLASLLLWQHADAYHMLLPLELCEPIRKRLAMYILRSKVKAADISCEHVLFGIAGADSAAVVTAITGSAPVSIHDVTHNAGVTVLMLPVQRYLVVATLDEAARVEATLLAAASASPETLWLTLDIEAGIPSVVAATQEQFVPQAVNFDLIGALSFDKGCYPGQEIVARAHYLGKVKQRMVRASIPAKLTPDIPKAGDKLYSEAFGNQASGMIVAAAAAGTAQTADGIYDVLAVIQSSSLDKSDVHWHAPDGPLLDIQPLPYAIK